MLVGLACGSWDVLGDDDPLPDSANRLLKTMPEFRTPSLQNITCAYSGRTHSAFCALSRLLHLEILGSTHLL